MTETHTSFSSSAHRRSRPLQRIAGYVPGSFTYEVPWRCRATRMPTGQSVGLGTRSQGSHWYYPDSCFTMQGACLQTLTVAGPAWVQQCKCGEQPRYT